MLSSLLFQKLNGEIRQTPALDPEIEENFLVPLYALGRVPQGLTQSLPVIPEVDAT